jgi:hypothetical protein
LHNATATATSKSYGIAYTSFPLRMRQVRETTGKTLEASKFIEICRDFGADGCQMDFSQLTSTESDYLKQVRQALEARQMYLEFAVSARLLEREETFAPVAKAASALGVTRLRVACLSGRRYETFQEMAKWQEFATHWKQVLKQAEPNVAQTQIALAASKITKTGWLMTSRNPQEHQAALPRRVRGFRQQRGLAGRFAGSGEEVGTVCSNDAFERYGGAAVCRRLRVV